MKTAIIIGAGPAGLTAAYELLTRTDIKPIILEKDNSVGGIAKTVIYKGNRIDIGGHRFFSKSARVMKWWFSMIPLEGTKNASDKDENILFERIRGSSVYFAGKFFDYPLEISLRTIMRLGPIRTARIGFSYIKSLIFKKNPEENLEHFFVNRFGEELYNIFFKNYTEKVWGVPCNEVSADWGRQRVKGLSISRAIGHFFTRSRERSGQDERQNTETSLIDSFLYPKLGCGQMWDVAAEKIISLGGRIETGSVVKKIEMLGNRITAVDVLDTKTGKSRKIEGDIFFSSMPVKELIDSLDIEVPPRVREVSDGLVYRDFVIVGILMDKLASKRDGKNMADIEKNNWVYIQAPDVQASRLQVFNNWSPYLVPDPNKILIGLEYFCYAKDSLWNKSEQDMIDLAISDMEKIGAAEKKDVLGAVVIKSEKAYPSYIGAYKDFDVLRGYLDSFENLFLIGRNGMHKYNNMDHSMLTAMTAVDNIVKNIRTKNNIWEINTEKEFHEKT